MVIEGKYNRAVVFQTAIEEEAAVQLKTLCDSPFVRGAKIRVMPDVHAGAGCVIGFTSDLTDMVVPDLVGVDIGCGMLTVDLGKKRPDFDLLDRAVRTRIPAGMEVRDEPIAPFEELETLRIASSLSDVGRLRRSLGTLGGGNHFIEVDVSSGGTYYLVIHTGSRNLGKQVAERYERLAVSCCKGKIRRRAMTKELIARYRAEGRERELSAALAVLDGEPEASALPDSLCYLTGAEREDYLADMGVCQRFACANRRAIAGELLTALGLPALDDTAHFETVHNYIDLGEGILRKGAVSARRGEILLIPMNMQAGSLLCRGKGNPEWNLSAPHGAGRAMSRSRARSLFTVEEFAARMQGIYTTSVSAATVDECPMAYKDPAEIAALLEPTADIIDRLVPVYNFKAG